MQSSQKHADCSGGATKNFCVSALYFVFHEALFGHSHLAADADQGSSKRANQKGKDSKAQ